MGVALYTKVGQRIDGTGNVWINMGDLIVGVIYNSVKTALGISYDGPQLSQQNHFHHKKNHFLQLLRP